MSKLTNAYLDACSIYHEEQAAARVKFKEKVSAFLIEYIKENGDIPFEACMSFDRYDPYWEDRPIVRIENARLPPEAIDSLNHIVHPAHDVFDFYPKDFGEGCWDQRQCYRNKCIATVVDGELVFKKVK